MTMNRMRFLIWMQIELPISLDNTASQYSTMKFIEPSYEILTPTDGKEILMFLERAIRTAYKSENKITPSSAPKLIRKIVHTYKHLSTIEHVSISVKFICDRGVSHEIVRHRLASYTQESTRYCNYTKNKFQNQLTYIIPPWLSKEAKQFLQAVTCSRPEIIPDGIPDKYMLELWLTSLKAAEDAYLNLIRHGGWTPQQARSVLPNALKTELVMTANLREWRHFFELRTAPEAHPQMRELAKPLLQEFRGKIPVIFDDI